MTEDEEADALPGSNSNKTFFIGVGIIFALTGGMIAVICFVKL